MKLKIDSKYIKWGITGFLVISSGICFYYLIFHIDSLVKNLSIFTNILMPIVFGLIMAYLLTPVLNFIEQKFLVVICDKIGLKEGVKRKRVLRGIGVLITAFLFFFIIYALVAMLLSQIVPSIQNIINNFDAYLTNILEWLDGLLTSYPEVKKYVTKNINKYSDEMELWLNNTVLIKTSELIKTVSHSVLSALGVLWDFIIGFIISIYVLVNKETFAGQSKKIVYALFERNTSNVIVNNFRFAHKTFIGFVGGKILDSAIIGILCFVGAVLLDVPYAVLVSVIIGVTNIIPFFGPFLGAIPTTILIFVVNPSQPMDCVYFALFIFALQQFDGNILGPKILGDSTGITGFWVIFSITLFGGLFGIVGMVIGVPLFAVMYAIIKAFVNEALRKKNMPEETEVYVDLGAVDDSGFHKYDSKAYTSASPKHKKQKKRNGTCLGNRFYSNEEDVLKDIKVQENEGGKTDQDKE